MLIVDHSAFSLVLRSVYIRRSNTWIEDSFDPLIPNQRLAARFRNQKPTLLVRPETQIGTDAVPQRIFTYLSEFDFEFALSNEDGTASDNSTPVAGVKAIFGVDYVSRGDMPSPEELDAWGGTSVIVHCWPYWREYCQSALARMSLPVIVMPMLDIQAVMAGDKNAPVSPAKKRTKKAKK